MTTEKNTHKHIASQSFLESKQVVTTYHNDQITDLKWAQINVWQVHIQEVNDFPVLKK